MSRAYARYIIEDFWPNLLFVSLFALLIAFALPYTFGTFEMAKMMRGMIESMPTPMRAMMNNDIEGFLSVQGSVGFSLKHPITISVLTYMAIILPVRYIGRAIEQGKMEIFLTLPLKRSSVFGTFTMVSVFFFAFAALLTAFGAFLGIKLLNTEAFPYLLLWKDMALLLVFFMFVFSISLLGSVWFKDPGKSVLWTVVFIAFFYLLDILARYKPWLAKTDKINLFKYYETQEIMNGKGHWGLDMMVLGVGALLLITLSQIIFQRRDIP